MKQVVLDTNTVVSGLFWNGAPRRILELAEAGRISVFSSPEIIDELVRVLNYRKFREKVLSTGLNARHLVDAYTHMSIIIRAGNLNAQVCEDPDDDKFLRRRRENGFHHFR